MKNSLRKEHRWRRRRRRRRCSEDPHLSSELSIGLTYSRLC
jgi:hypothetical protein